MAGVLLAWVCFATPGLAEDLPGDPGNETIASPNDSAEPAAPASDAGEAPLETNAEDPAELQEEAAGSPDASMADPEGPREPPAEEAEPPDDPAAFPDQAEVRAADPVANYLDAIDRAEAFSSAYSPELADLYLGLGQSLLQREEYDAAREAFQAGMQIVRVNFGLDSIDQAQYLFSIAEIESRLGNWRTANEVLQHVYLINARSYSDRQLDMLPVLSQLQNFYLQKFNRLSPEYAYANLVRAERLTQKMASIIELENGLNHPDTARIYRRVGQLHYLMAKHLLEYQGVGPLGATLASDSRHQPRNVIQVSEMTHFIGGRDAFAKVAESIGQAEERNDLEYANALAQLADWNLIFGKSQAASEYYHQAYSVLASIDESNRLNDELFGAPTPLQFFNDLEEMPAIVQSPADDENVEMSMTITRIGKIQNLEILKAPEGMEKDELRKLERGFASIRFRPRVMDGILEKTENFIWHYPLNPGQNEDEIN